MHTPTRAKDVQGTPTNGGQFAATDETVTLGVETTATPQDLFNQVRSLDRRMEQLKKERNEVLLQSSIARAKEQFPDATELRLGFHRHARYEPSKLQVKAIIHQDGTRLSAGDGTIHTDNWQHDSSGGGFFSIELGVSMMGGISAITKDGEGVEDRFRSDSVANEIVIDLH